MNLTIKDLSTTTELDHAAMAAVRGGSQGNADVGTILQGQQVWVPVMTASGPGSAQNVFVDVSADQSGSQDTKQNNGDKLAVTLGFLREVRGLV
jgi:hypothetical protein